MAITYATSFSRRHRFKKKVNIFHAAVKLCRSRFRLTKQCHMLLINEIREGI